MSSAIDPLPRGQSECRPLPSRRAAEGRRSASRARPVPVAVPAEDAGFIDTAALRRQTPAWAVSLLLHIVALLMLALFVSRPDDKPKATDISARAAEEDPSPTEFDAPLPRPVIPEPTPAATLTDIPTLLESGLSTLPAEPPVTAGFADVESLLPGLPEGMTGQEGIGPSTGPGVGPAGNDGFTGRQQRRGTANPVIEAAVDRALEWLAAHQMPDGSWSFRLDTCPACQGKCSRNGTYPDDAAATALALLPFLGRGYTHKDGPYRKQIAGGLAILAKRSADNQGQIYAGGGHGMYVQGLAAIALAEAYGMSQDERLHAPTQAALNFIMQAQDPVGGGWRYTPRQPGDTSAVGWQIMALKSGHMAYLEVNPQTIRKAGLFLDAVSNDSGSGYGYTEPGAAAGTTAVGLLCRMYLGWKKDHPALARGVAELARKGPSQDLYYDYYATQVMHHMEGDAWTGWNDTMKALLLAAQVQQGHERGSWYDGVSGGHGGSQGGRLYTTALATLILEVTYRHAPLYRTQAVDEFRE
jgi:hypothetical protein